MAEHPPCAQAMDNMMPGFDREIAKLAQRVLINPRSIDFHTGVLASKVIPGDCSDDLLDPRPSASMSSRSTRAMRKLQPCAALCNAASCLQQRSWLTKPCT